MPRCVARPRAAVRWLPPALLAAGTLRRERAICGAVYRPLCQRQQQQTMFSLVRRRMSEPSAGVSATVPSGESTSSAAQDAGAAGADNGGGYDARATDIACTALAFSVASGNRPQFEALVVALRTLLPPPQDPVLGPPEEAPLEKADFVWQEHDFMSGPEGNLKILRGFEAEYAKCVAAAPTGFRNPKVLAASLDLACAYIKNYALDKADALYMAIEPFCMERGLPWDVKCLQDMATLRCKQARQQEAVVLLEEVARRTPPHSATLRNLGTVYNMLGQHEKARDYFQTAMTLDGHTAPDKDDLWNIGLAKKNLGEYEEGLSMLFQALEGWKRDDPDDDVTIAKLHDSVGGCLDAMGRYDEAASQYEQARELYGRSLGTANPLYGSACEGLAKARIHGERFEEGFEALQEAFRNAAAKDAVHPTPLYELLGLALTDCVGRGGLSPEALTVLEEPISIAVRNLRHRGLDQDGNAGVIFERMAEVLLRCSPAEGDSEQQADAAKRRALAGILLERAGPLVEETTRSGQADLSHISMLIAMQLKAIAIQDAIYGRTGDARSESSQRPRFDSSGSAPPGE
mmetsp:Transcript_37711/g.82849  ORF Transcript_37711/g.82849 Transcript_37711/m.82849 type:complete len:575 (-) Transcript_37711:74-1798(-)